MPITSMEIKKVSPTDHNELARVLALHSKGQWFNLQQQQPEKLLLWTDESSWMLSKPQSQTYVKDILFEAQKTKSNRVID